MNRTGDPAPFAARPLRDAPYGELVWSRPGLFRRELRLESGSELLALLRWERIFSFEAIAESGDGRWIIGRRRRGGVGGGVVMREAGTDAEVASLTRGWQGTGTVRFVSGTEFGWEREGFWRPTYGWTSTREGRFITFTSAFGWKRSLEMTLGPAARQVAELPALVLLGGYVMAMIAAESAAH